MSVPPVRSKFNNREISSTEVTKATLNRIAKLEPRLNAFITVTPENAIRDAQEADERLLGTGQEPTALTGVPVMVKDNFSTKDVQTKAALIKGALPARKDASTEGFDHCSQNALALLSGGSAALHWNVRDSGFKGVLKEVVSQFWNSDMSPENARKALVDGLKQL